MDQKKKKNCKSCKKIFPGFINKLTDYNFNQVSLTKCSLSQCIVFFFTIESMYRHQPVGQESQTI